MAGSAEKLDRDLVDSRFAQESRRLLVERLRVVIAVAAPLYLGFWLLDLLARPDLAPTFLILRLAATAWFALGFGLTYTGPGRRSIEAMSVGVMFVGTALIIWMTSLDRGFESTYYLGILLGLFVVGLFLPLRVRTTVAFCALVLFTYFIANLAAFGLSQPRAAIEAAFFLGGTGFLAVSASATSARRRRRELELRLRLQRANRELRALDEAKTRFFANVSHELRTPLTLVMAPLERLAAAVTRDDDRALVRTVRDNAQRLLRQVNMILDVTKIEAGRLELDPSETDVGDLLSNLVESARAHANGRNIELITDGLDRLPAATLDAVKIEVAAANLISNAIKFTPPGGRVTVRARHDAGRLRFEVEDTGPGVPADQRDRIFERFYQLDTSATRPHEGTGLGLALARELVRLHGGDISVGDAETGGARFVAEFPPAPPASGDRRRGYRRREDRLAMARIDGLVAERFRSEGAVTLLADVSAPHLESAAGAPAGAGSPRVLIAEDNTDLRAFLCRSLSRSFRIEGTADGAEALEAARRERPDVIIADVMMPHVDGLELCRTLRRSPSLAAVPIILLTARAGIDAVVEGLGSGADDYLAKPFDVRELEARIAARLQARAQERRLDEHESRLLAIGGMTARIVHDLRNPLTAITAVASIGDLPDASRSHRQQEILVREAERLRVMLEELLEYARAGDAALELRDTDLARFLPDALRPAAAELEHAGVRLAVEADAVAGVTVTLDRARMQRVLENLVYNARDALRDHGGADPRVEVRAGRERDAVVIRVVDNGPGIPDEIRQSLFEPFVTANKRGGVGLGLVTARNLARAHRGEITVEPRSPPGGAAFRVTLPRRPAGNDAESREVPRTE